MSLFLDALAGLTAWPGFGVGPRIGWVRGDWCWLLATHDAIGPDLLARLVEVRGHESLFFAGHTHIPASRASPIPGGDLPRRYAHTYDLFVDLTAAAVVTTRPRVGSGVCLVIEHDPIITAKEVANVDRLSGGRFESAVADLHGR